MTRLLPGAWLLLVGCSSAIQQVGRVDRCAQLTPPRWTPASSDWAAPTRVREIRIALDVDPDTRDGWGAYGGRRLRAAISHWNNLSLPVKLVPTTSPRSADITVHVIPSFPRDGKDRPGVRYRAGLTNLTYAAGEISRAQVVIAEATPFEERYSVADQAATLLHELGHALGLPHVADPGALMATRTRVNGVTAVDVTLARTVYSRRGCPGVQLAANEDFPGQP